MGLYGSIEDPPCADSAQNLPASMIWQLTLIVIKIIILIINFLTWRLQLAINLIRPKRPCWCFQSLNFTLAAGYVPVCRCWCNSIAFERGFRFIGMYVDVELSVTIGRLVWRYGQHLSRQNWRKRLKLCDQRYGNTQQSPFQATAITVQKCSTFELSKTVSIKALLQTVYGFWFPGISELFRLTRRAASAKQHKWKHNKKRPNGLYLGICRSSEN